MNAHLSEQAAASWFWNGRLTVGIGWSVLFIVMFIMLLCYPGEGRDPVQKERGRPGQDRNPVQKERGRQGQDRNPVQKQEDLVLLANGGLVLGISRASLGIEEDQSQGKNAAHHLEGGGK